MEFDDLALTEDPVLPPKPSPMEKAIEDDESPWARRFFLNVIWSWLGVGASFLTGFFLSPYIIRKLGDHRYGIWALAFAFIDYFMLFDFGFKSATVNFVSRARAEGDTRRINEIINTGLFYFIGIALLLLGFTLAISGHLDWFLKITPEYRGEFTLLIRLISVGWATAIALNVFNAATEAFQQFKVQNVISVSSLVIRSGGCAIAVFLGYGLGAMGVIVLLTQILTFSLLFLNFRRIFPALRITPKYARAQTWKDLAKYGMHAFLAYVATMLLYQGAPLMIGHFLTESFVGYYTLPSRLLLNAVDMVTRIGNVTMPNTADLAERGKHAELTGFATYLNRYCFALFMPMAIFLLVDGRSLIQVWVGAKFALQAAPLLPAFVILTSLAVAGQFNSSTILFGLAKHQIYSRVLLTEAVLSLATMAVIVPKYGILGGAWVAAGFAILSRGLATPYLLSRELKFSVFVYLRNIYSIPALIAVPVFAWAYWLKSQMSLGRHWVDLILMLALIAAPYYLAVFFAIVEREHRAIFYSWIRGLLRSAGLRRVAV